MARTVETMSTSSIKGVLTEIGRHWIDGGASYSQVHNLFAEVSDVYPNKIGFLKQHSEH